MRHIPSKPLATTEDHRKDRAMRYRAAPAIGNARPMNDLLPANNRDEPFGEFPGLIAFPGSGSV